MSEHINLYSLVPVLKVVYAYNTKHRLRANNVIVDFQGVSWTHWSRFSNTVVSPSTVIEKFDNTSGQHSFEELF